MSFLEQRLPVFDYRCISILQQILGQGHHVCHVMWFKAPLYIYGLTSVLWIDEATHRAERPLIIQISGGKRTEEQDTTNTCNYD